MGKHAYLISVHNKPNQLKRLIKILDDERNDLYVHIDKKAYDIYNSETIKNLHDTIRKGRIFFLETNIPVSWGQYSQIQSKLELLKEAVQNGPYKYYHNISGQDFPLKTQDEIHRFFEIHNGKEFLSIETGTGHDYSYRYKYYYDFLQAIGRPATKSQKVKIVAYAVLQKVLFGIDRTKENKNVIFKKGGGWFSLTEEFVQYLLSNESWIKDTFTSTYCCDEVFLQTVFWNSPFRNSLYIPDDGETETMRLIDWNKGHPYTYRISDFEELRNSKCLWARKFDENVDNEIITQLEALLSEGEKGLENKFGVCSGLG